MDLTSLDDLSKSATIVSGFLTPLVVVAAFLAARIYSRQLKVLIEQTAVLTRQSEASVIVPLVRRYAEPAMHAAVRTIWHDPPVLFTARDTERDHQRRMVHHFWLEIAILCQRRIISEELVFSVFPDVDTLEKIHPLWERTLVPIIKRNRPTLSAEQISDIAKAWVERSATAELYRKWLNRAVKEPWKAR
jgi:hypothetical protein